MKSFEKDVSDVGKVEFVEFDSLHDFKSYITTTPINNAFKKIDYKHLNLQLKILVTFANMNLFSMVFVLIKIFMKKRNKSQS